MLDILGFVAVFSIHNHVFVVHASSAEEQRQCACVVWLSVSQPAPKCKVFVLLLGKVAIIA